MKNLALLMADTHLMPSTVEVNRSIFKQAIDYCLKKGIKRIFHLGDLLDSRKAQTQEILNILGELFQMVSDAGLDMIIIAGNHDKTNYESDISFLVPFQHYPNITLVRDYMGVGSKTYPEFPEGMIVTFLPFFEEKTGAYTQQLKKHVQATSGYDKKILLTHVGIDGAKMNSGIEIENHLKKSLFDPFDKVYIGHYHDFQELKGGKIVYIGSCFQENFGENNQKGFSILKDNGSIEFVKAKFPEFKKVCIDMDTATKDDILKLKKEYEDSEDNIRFAFKGAKEKLAKIDKQEFVSLGIDVKTEEADPEVVNYGEQQVVTFDGEKILEEWKGFTKEDKENRELGLEYLNK